MKIQPSSTKPTATSKKSTSTKNGASFDALFSSQADSTEATTSTPVQTAQHETLEHPNPSLDKALQTLEDTALNLETNTGNHQQAQDVVDKLRGELQQSSPLSEQDKREAETLLAVESKRLEALKKYEG